MKDDLSNFKAGVSRKVGRRVYPNECALPAGLAGLTVESLVLAHQIRTLSRERIDRPTGVIADAGWQRRIRDVMLYHFDLE